MDDIKQRVLEQTGEMFTEFDKNAKSGLLAGLEDENASLAHLPIQPEEPQPEPKSEAELLSEALVQDDGLEGEDLPEVEELEELEEIGYDIVIYPVCTVLTAAQAMRTMLNSLRDNHSNREIIEKKMVTGFGEYNDIVGMKALTDMEKAFQVDVFKKKHAEEQ